MYVDALDVQLLGKIQNITITPDECVHNLTIIVIPDGVAQEGNETFSLLITNFDASLLGENASFIGRMDITIIDSDGKIPIFSPKLIQEWPH
jgi:hypothetical protein